MADFDENEIDLVDIELADISELFHSNPDLFDDDSEKENDLAAISEIEELLAIDPAIFDVSLSFTFKYFIFDLL